MVHIWRGRRMWVQLLCRRIRGEVTDLVRCVAPYQGPWFLRYQHRRGWYHTAPSTTASTIPSSTALGLQNSTPK
eukprot:783108-Rhodomonas_salina.1